MNNNKLENLEERLEDLEFERETCVIKLQSLNENGLCASLEQEKAKTNKKLKIIQNLIRELDLQKREVTEEKMPELLGVEIQQTKDELQDLQQEIENVNIHQRILIYIRGYNA